MLIEPLTRIDQITAGDALLISDGRRIIATTAKIVLESLRSVAATMRQQIDRQTKLIEDARYIIHAFDNGADHAEYGREIWEWQHDLDPKLNEVENVGTN